MRRLVLFLFVALIAIPGSCQLVPKIDHITTEADKAVAAKVLGELQEAYSGSVTAGTPLPVSGLMIMAAESLLGTPYVAGTLDEDPIEERLRVYLTKTDCILFVETCLALAKTVTESGGRDVSFDSFVAQVAGTRYRVKPPYLYSDRVHYTTEWARRQEGKSLKDMTLELGGETYDHPVNFMTRHPESYKQLQDAASIPRAALNLKRIGEVEDELNKVPMTYIPKQKIPSVEKGIQSGDIICFVSSVEGLDIAHVAMAYVKNGRVGFIHASQKEGKVVIDGQTIADYVAHRSNLSGIKVIRPL